MKDFAINHPGEAFMEGGELSAYKQFEFNSKNRTETIDLTLGMNPSYQIKKMKSTSKKLLLGPDK